MTPGGGTVAVAGLRLAALVVGVTMGAVFALSPAAAQDIPMRQLLDRIERLERDIRSLNLQIARGPSQGREAMTTGQAASPVVATGGETALAQIEVRLTALEDELRGLTGQAETLGHQVDQLVQRLDKLVGDIDIRLGSIERGARAAPGPGAPGAPGAPGPATPLASAPMTPPAAQPDQPSGGPGFATPPQSLGTISPSDLSELAARTGRTQPGAAGPAAPSSPPAAPQQASVLPAGTVKDQYEYATKLLFAQRFDEAEKVLQAFLAAHPDDPLASNATYWLGETYYVRRDYTAAAKVFADGYKKYKTGSKAPDSLLKLAMSLAAADKKEGACLSLTELDRAFPNAAKHIQDQARRERERTGCK